MEEKDSMVSGLEPAKAPDAYEELQDDVISWCHARNIQSRTVLDFLDRQAEITKAVGSIAYMDMRDYLRRELAKRDKGIERLKKRRDELESEVERLRAELNTAESDNEYLRDAGRKPTDAVRKFAERYETRIEELERLWHTFEDEVAAQSVEIAERDKRIAELEAEVNAKDGYIAHKLGLQGLDHYQQRIDELEAELRKFKDMNNEVNAECSELQEQVDMLTERKCPGYEPEGHYCCYHAQDFELNDTTVSRLKRENARLEAERDEWKAEAEKEKFDAEIYGRRAVNWEEKCHELQERVERHQVEAIGEWELRCEMLTAERDELKTMNEKLQVALDAVEGCDERCKKLEAERDEALEIRDKALGDAATFKYERDEWKAKAEAKSAKRTAAVERLKDARYHTLADYVRAMLGWGHEPHFEDCRDALIDLLTDESCGQDAEQGIRAEAPVRESCTNLEWLYKHDDAMCTAVNAFASEHHFEAYDGELRKWLMAPHENGIRRENAPETPDSAEIPQKTPEEGQKDDALDSREKLEADIRANCYHEAMPAGGRSWMLNDGVFESVVIGWLDRQAAITERECREYEDALREQHHKRIAELEDELHRSYDAQGAKAEELTLRGVRIAELEAEHDRMQGVIDDYEDSTTELEESISVLESERDEWHEKAAELEIELAQVRGNLKNATHNYAIAKAKCEGREQRALQRERRADEKMAEAERAIAEPPDERVRELIAKLESERDGWRMRCGKLLDAAHGMQGIADEWDEEVR